MATSSPPPAPQRAAIELSMALRSVAAITIAAGEPPVLIANLLVCQAIEIYRAVGKRPDEIDILLSQIVAGHHGG